MLGSLPDRKSEITASQIQDALERILQSLRDANGEYEKGGLSDLKLSYIYLALGDLESCFHCLERDYEQRDPELPYINADPVFDPVRTHPRFIALLKMMNLQKF